MISAAMTTFSIKTAVTQCNIPMALFEAKNLLSSTKNTFQPSFLISFVQSNFFCKNLTCNSNSCEQGSWDSRKQGRGSWKADRCGLVHQRWRVFQTRAKGHYDDDVDHQLTDTHKNTSSTEFIPSPIPFNWKWRALVTPNMYPKMGDRWTQNKEIEIKNRPNNTKKGA